MSRRSMSPGNLLVKMTDGEWLEKMSVRLGSVVMVHIYHDDGCPCESGRRGLPACTCHTVEYDFSDAL